MNKEILKEDIRDFDLPEELKEKLRGMRIIVTGATGLIGSVFVRALNSLGLGIRFILPVRNREKAEKLYEQEKGSLEIVEQELTTFFNNLEDETDYILHCASPTEGRYMTDHPVETFLTAVDTTKSILEYARRTKVKGIVYVSTIEYYGQIFDEEPVTEARTGYVDPESPRSSYPLGKQAAEFLCRSYASEYSVPVMAARLTQTFGAGISETDNRVFAQFARSVIEGRDIVLHTSGESSKPYCYTTDCVSALVLILLKGKPGEAYNVATPRTYVSIRELAEIFQRYNPEIKVVTQVQEGAAYAPETKVNLSSRKLLLLGWEPRYDLPQMAERLINYLN